MWEGLSTGRLGAWFGFVSRVALRRLYESDGFLGPEGGRLMVVVHEESVGLCPG